MSFELLGTVVVGLLTQPASCGLLGLGEPRCEWLLSCLFKDGHSSLT